MCEESMPPSNAWSQLHSWTTFDIPRWVGGTWVHSNFGGGGICSRGPI